MWNHVNTVNELKPRTTNAAEVFNGCINKTCPPNTGFWRVVDILYMYAQLAEKEIVQVQGGKVPEKTSDATCRKALEKMKKIRATVKFDYTTEALLEALAQHSETDWAGRPKMKLFEDADAAMNADYSD